MKEPPKIAQWILSITNSRRNRENITGDLREFYQEIAESSGKNEADRWMWRQALKSIPDFINSSLYWGGVMLKNYVKITVRNIFRDKGYSFINITGFAVGIACSIMIMLWVMHELDFDKFNTKGSRIHRVLQHIKYDEVVTWAITQGPLAPALLEEVVGIDNYTRVRRTSWRVTYSDQTLSREGIYVDPGFFDMFDYKVLKGDPMDLDREPNSVLLTESYAKDIFGDEDPINKVVSLYEVMDVKVVGIMEDCPDNSHIRYEYISGMKLAKKFNYTVDEWTNSGFVTYLLLNENIDPQDVEEKIYNFLDDKPTLEKWEKLTLQPLYDIHLSSNIGFDPSVTINADYVMIFSFAAGLILLLAVINYVNLATARSVLRSKEVGLRKTIGAKKGQLISQFMGESATITLLATILGILLVALFIPVFNEISGKDFILQDFMRFDFLLKIFTIIFIAGFIAGTYPAFVLSSINPINSIRGFMNNKGERNNSRKIMVVIQYSISSILLIGAFIIFQQIDFLKNKSLGYNKDHLIYFYLSKNTVDKYQVLRNELLKNDKIKKVSSSSTIPYYGITFSNAKWFWEGSDRENPTLIRTTYIDDTYLDTYEIDVLAGRNFSKDFPSDTLALVINETAAKIIGIEDPIGKTIYYDRPDEPIPLTIVGICNDYNFLNLRSEVEPLFHLYNSSLYGISVRLDPNEINETLTWMRSKITSTAPGAVFDYRFLDKTLESLYQSEQKVGNIILYFTFLAVLISSLGLFGMAAFAASRRTREIGIRKVLGSGVSKLIILLIREFSKWIIFANIISWPIAYYLMNNWLQEYPYRIEIGIEIFLLSGLLSLLLGTGTIFYKTYRAATLNPVDTLKYE